MKKKIHIPYNPEIPLVGMSSKATLAHGFNMTWAEMFIAIFPLIKIKTNPTFMVDTLAHQE